MRIGSGLGAAILCVFLVSCESAPDGQPRYEAPDRPYLPAAPESKALQIMKAVHFPPAAAQSAQDEFSADYLKRARLMVFMPREEARDAMEAAAKIDALVIDALGEAVHEQFAGRSAMQSRQNQVWNTRTRAFNPAERLYFIPKDAACQTKGIACGYSYLSLSSKTGLDAVIPLYAPAILGGYPAWGFDFANHSFLPLFTPSAHDAEGKRIALLPDDAVFKKLSGKLPGWAFIYLGQGVTARFDPASSSFRFIEEPILLNRGEEIPF